MSLLASLAVSTVHKVPLSWPSPFSEEQNAHFGGKYYKQAHILKLLT